MIQFDYSSSELYKKYNNLELSSVLGEDNFFYGLYDISTNKLVAAKLITDLPGSYLYDEGKLDKILEKEGLYHPSIKNSKFAYVAPYFTLIPEDHSAMDDDIIGESFSGKYYDKDFVLKTQKLSNIPALMKFLVPSSLEQLLEKKYEVLSLIHLNAALADNVLGLFDTFIYFNFVNHQFQTVVVKNGELLQTNNYPVSGKDDALYFALLNCRQFDLYPDRDKFLLSGNLPENSPQISLFKDYFKNIELHSVNNRLSYSNVFLGKSKSLFFSLDCVHQCES